MEVYGFKSPELFQCCVLQGFCFFVNIFYLLLVNIVSAQFVKSQLGLLRLRLITYAEERDPRPVYCYFCIKDIMR